MLKCISRGGMVILREYRLDYEVLVIVKPVLPGVMFMEMESPGLLVNLGRPAPKLQY